MEARASAHLPPTCCDVQARGVRSRRVRLGGGQCRLRQDARAGAARDQSSARAASRRKKSSASPSPRPPPPIWRSACSTRSRAGRRSTTTALDAAIARSAPGACRTARRALARRLFARALETPGGLKVQTIHAFCTQLLHQFPFEANVAARFTVLDETAQMQLLEDLTLEALLEGASAPESAARPRARHRHDGRAPIRRSATSCAKRSRRDAFIALDACGPAASKMRSRSFRARSASRRKKRLKASRLSSSPDSLIRGNGMAGDCRGARARQQDRRRAGAALHRAHRTDRRQSHRALSGDLLHGRRQAAQIHRHQGDQGCAAGRASRTPSRAASVTFSSGAMPWSAATAPPRFSPSRDAVLRALRGREGTPRPARL